jgi:hypothetical protein
MNPSCEIFVPREKSRERISEHHKIKEVKRNNYRAQVNSQSQNNADKVSNPNNCPIGKSNSI